MNNLEWLLEKVIQQSHRQWPVCTYKKNEHDKSWWFFIAMFDYQGYMKQGLEHCLRMVAQRGVELGAEELPQYVK